MVVSPDFAWAKGSLYLSQQPGTINKRFQHSISRYSDTVLFEETGEKVSSANTNVNAIIRLTTSDEATVAAPNCVREDAAPVYRLACSELWGILLLAVQASDREPVWHMPTHNLD